MHIPELALVAGAAVFVSLFIPLLVLLKALSESDIVALRGYIEFSAVISKPLELTMWYHKFVLSALRSK